MVCNHVCALIFFVNFPAVTRIESAERPIIHHGSPHRHHTTAVSAAVKAQEERARSRERSAEGGKANAKRFWTTFSQQHIKCSILPLLPIINNSKYQGAAESKRALQHISFPKRFKHAPKDAGERQIAEQAEREASFL